MEETIRTNALSVSPLQAAGWTRHPPTDVPPQPRLPQPAALPAVCGAAPKTFCAVLEPGTRRVLRPPCAGGMPQSSVVMIRKRTAIRSLAHAPPPLESADVYGRTYPCNRNHTRHSTMALGNSEPSPTLVHAPRTGHSTGRRLAVPLLKPVSGRQSVYFTETVD